LHTVLMIDPLDPPKIPTRTSDTRAMNLNKESIESVDVAGKRVLMRVDFNVPMDKSGAITNNQVCLCRAS
jgi:hypothetical protein